MKQTLVGIAVLLSGFLFGGCGAVYYVGMPFVYDTVRPDSVVEFRDERYFDGPTDEDAKTRLDMFYPESEGWPVLVFVHGGGWTAGDKDLRVGRKDVYRNIGRYFASKNIGVAVVNYRLLPGVHWTTQLRDVARAILYARTRAAEEGGDASRLFVSGHSAGAQLVTRVALDEAIMEELGSSREIICGVVAVSGAGYDMEDAETFALGAQFSYLKSRFGQVDGTETWPHDASVMQFIDDSAPPFLVAYGSAEPRGLQRQSQVLADRLQSKGVYVDTVVEPGYNHPRMVLALSRSDREAPRRVAAFIGEARCGTPNTPSR